jgi:hypothetical protein
MSIRVERTDRFGERFSLRTQDLLGAESLIDTLTRDEATAAPRRPHPRPARQLPAVEHLPAGVPAV